MAIRRVERNRWILAATASPLALAALALAAGLGTVALFPVLAAALAMWVAWQRNPRPRLRPVEIRRDGEHVHVGAERHPRSALRGAYVLPRVQGVRVVLERAAHRGDVELEVADEPAARELLHAIGMAPEQAVGRFLGTSRLQAHPRLALVVATGGVLSLVGLTAATVSLFGVNGGVVVSALAYAAFMALALAPSRIDVGADGILLGWLGTQRFVRWVEVSSVEARVVGVGRLCAAVVTLVSGEVLNLTVAGAAYDGGRAAALVARIRAARAAAAEPAGDVAFVRKDGESHADWVRRLRATLELVTPRRATSTPERLWRIVENAASEPLERVAAAVALGKLDGAGRRRLTQVASVTAAPRLRVALEQVGEDEAVAEALAELEGERARTAQSVPGGSGARNEPRGGASLRAQPSRHARGKV